MDLGGRLAGVRDHSLVRTRKCLSTFRARREATLKLGYLAQCSAAQRSVAQTDLRKCSHIRRRNAPSLSSPSGRAPMQGNLIETLDNLCPFRSRYSLTAGYASTPLTVIQLLLIIYALFERQLERMLCERT